MNNIGYILNLSSNFNANNYMYYFLHGICAGKILHFDELTKNPLPSNSNYQKKEIDEKIWELKNHFDLYKLNPHNDFQYLKINIILDYSRWGFLNFGMYSSFPFTKIFYIESEFKKVINHFDFSKIIFQYFIINHIDNQNETAIKLIDNEKGILTSQELPSTIKWPNFNTFHAIINKTIPIGQVNLETPTPKHLLDEFDNEIIRPLYGLLLSSFELNDAFKEFVNENFRLLKKQMHESISSVKYVNNTEIRKKILEDFFKRFSSSHFLRYDKDLIFRISIDSGNINSKINSYNALSSLLVESIDFFDQNESIDFMTNGAKNQTINIKSISFDDNKVTDLVSKYKALAANGQKSKEDSYSKKHKVKQFTFNHELDSSQYYSIDENRKTEFLTVNNLKRKIGYFYSKTKVTDIATTLESNNIEDLENSIRLQESRTSEAYNLNGEYGLAASKESFSYKEIEKKLKELKEEENNSKLISNVDFEKYNRTKQTHEKEIKKLNKQFVQSLRILPQIFYLVLFFVLSMVFVFNYFSPLYFYNFWEESLYFTAIYISVSFIALLITWYVLRNRIITNYEKIFQQNQKLLTAFKTYVTSLKELAVNVRKSTLRRKNIEELERAKNQIHQEEQKFVFYQNFYNEIVMQLSKNNVELNKCSIDAQPDFVCSPYKDKRVLSQRLEHSLIIKAGISENENTVSSLLGIINCIESN